MTDERRTAVANLIFARLAEILQRLARLEDYLAEISPKASMPLIASTGRSVTAHDRIRRASGLVAEGPRR